MDIFVVGLSHKTAPVSVREKVAFAPEKLAEALHQLAQSPQLAESLILSTCNRVELYAGGPDCGAGIRALKEFLAHYHHLSVDDLDGHLYVKQGEEAIRHVFRVAASLDSMVVGEPQILGQIKTAYGHAAEQGTVGLILNRFLHKAFSVAKRVRTETNIAGNAVSVSFAAVELARKIFGSIEGKKVLLIGAGEMCELAARHFVNNGINRVLVTNRTFARAEKLAEEFSGQAVLFENFPDHLHQVDIVLSSTGATRFIISPEMVQQALKQRKNRPMFFIDIAVPRDIDPRVNDLNNAYLYDVDDLQGVVNANLKERQREAELAEQIIEHEIGQFQRWMRGLDVVPTIVALRNKVEQLRRAEVDKTLGNLKHLGASERKAIEAMSAALINKILHTPTRVLKQAQQQEDEEAQLCVDALQRLFDLEIAAPEGELKSMDDH
ncbi:MAG: glutamyl-tRNA reductase [Desulfuromonadaceae bacterium]|nr:glutamyl-tRNA reductase [Desulfuromonadaceae bacterium]